MNQLQKIDYLISEYKSGAYKTETFCDEFVRILYNEKDGSIEYKLWDILDTYAKVFSRFSPFEEDVEKGILFDENKIKSEFQRLLEFWNHNN